MHCPQTIIYNFPPFPQRCTNNDDFLNCCRLSPTYFHSEIGIDTAENEPQQVCRTVWAREPWVGAVPGRSSPAPRGSQGRGGGRHRRARSHRINELLGSDERQLQINLGTTTMLRIEAETVTHRMFFSDLTSTGSFG